jgi:hypothetical protein
MVMESLDDDCMLEILRFLSAADLNTFAMCSRRCREARSNPLLDQTRTGTIVFQSIIRYLLIDKLLVANEWNAVFSGNRTSLRVVGLENCLNTRKCSEFFFWIDRWLHVHRGDSQLTGVTSLDMSCSPGPVREVVDKPCTALALMLPNLRELDLSYMDTIEYPMLAQVFCRNCPHLTRITWNGSGICFDLDGFCFKNAANLAELSLDDCRFQTGGLHRRYWEQEVFDHRGLNTYMLMYCTHLERLSIKNVKGYSDEFGPRLDSQEFIIKFVRHTSTLRWLRSDLTEENVTMLQKERPDVTFL